MHTCIHTYIHTYIHAACTVSTRHTICNNYEFDRKLVERHQRNQSFAFEYYRELVPNS